ncbi:MAG TPA: hypothetical protein VKY57_15470 [Chitinispirillaceae bacterium]|nr:hypothetical protein [Chitinispirillaceae bacterium]
MNFFTDNVFGQIIRFRLIMVDPLTKKLHNYVSIPETDINKKAGFCRISAIIISTVYVVITEIPKKNLHDYF